MGQKEERKSRKKKSSKVLTVMLISDPLKKPLQFSIPKWSIKLCLASVLVISAVAIYSSSSAYSMRKIAGEKAALERELAEIESMKQDIIVENARLREDVADRDLQLVELEELSEKTMISLKELYDRENVIRQELGLETVEFEESGFVLNSNESDIQASNLYSTCISPLSLKYDYGFVNVPTSKYMLLSNELELKKQDYDNYLNIIASAKFQEEQRLKALFELRVGVADYALQFLGGRYVYGSNDPNTGVDCSGFTRYVLRNAAGVYLNRTAAAQSGQGVSVSIDEAKPGDLIFYGSGERINHVALYLGDGKVVHASNEKNGIIVSKWNYRTPVKIKNVIGS